MPIIKTTKLTRAGGTIATAIDKAVPVVGGKSDVPSKLIGQRHRKAHGDTGEIDKIVSAIQRMNLAFKLAGAGLGNFLDIPMPNGKTMGDCTGDYGREIGEWMQEIGREDDDTPITSDILRAVFDARPELLSRYRSLAKREAA
jgi:hypothetical protein